MYHGRIEVSNEMLKQLLKIEEDVEITSVFQTESNKLSNTTSIMIVSEKLTAITLSTHEGWHIPITKSYDNGGI